MREHSTDQIYHVVSRGVDKRTIFCDEKDRYRFIHDMYEFNDTEPVNNLTYFFRKDSKVIARPYIERGPRKLLVEVLAFCMMPNHYHLLIKPRFEDGMTRFMKKLNMGYARYFNEKYERTGALFQGRYKSVLVSKEPHFIHLPYYIHLNPLDLKAPEWRESKLKDYHQAIKFLENYRWSSHLDYLGKKNFPSVTQREFLLDFFNGPKGYERSVNGWLKDLNLATIQDILLD